MAAHNDPNPAFAGTLITHYLRLSLRSAGVKISEAMEEEFKTIDDAFLSIGRVTHSEKAMLIKGGRQ